MAERHLIVDGMMSGTGIRDAMAGDYLFTDELGLSSHLREEIVEWLGGYERAHFRRYKDENENRRLDVEGTEIAKRVQEELPNDKVQYYSNAYLKRIQIA